MTTNSRFQSVLLASLVLACASALRADVIHFEALLSGPAESPPNASPATGTADVFYDNVLHTLRVDTTFSGLLGETTAAHIHAPTSLPFQGTAPVATPVPFFPGFPIGVHSGSYDQTFDLTQSSSYNPTFLAAQGGSTAAAESALMGALMTGKAYLNIHSTEFRAGEIRGFPTVPDNGPAAVLLAISLGGFVAFVGIRKAWENH